MKLIALRPPQFFRSASKSGEEEEGGKRRRRRREKRVTTTHLSPRSNPGSSSSSFGSAAASEESEESAGRRTPTSVLGRGVTRREVEAVLRRMAPAEEVAAMMAEAEAEGLAGDWGALGTEGTGGEEEELRGAFGVFDADGDGRISAEELREMLVGLGDDRCSLDDCRRMIGGVDTDGDGFVGFGDFVRMMTVAKI